MLKQITGITLLILFFTNGLFAQKLIRIDEYDPVIYQDCANILVFELPEPYGDKALEYDILGADLVEEVSKENPHHAELVIVPEKEKEIVTIILKEDGTEINRFEFRAHQVPLPEIVVNRKELELPLKGKLTLDYKVDEKFKQVVPRGSEFESSWIVSLQRNNNLVKEKVFHVDEIDLSEYSDHARSGDKLIITPMNLDRLTYKGIVDQIERPVRVALTIK